jgi:hypothetical protein
MDLTYSTSLSSTRTMMTPPITWQSSVIVFNLNNYNKDVSPRVLRKEKNGDPSPRGLGGEEWRSVHKYLEEIRLQEGSLGGEQDMMETRVQ